MISLPIPPFDQTGKMHRILARAGVHTEDVAATVELRGGLHFVKARQQIRGVLREDGIASKIDAQNSYGGKIHYSKSLTYLYSTGKVG